MRIVLLLARLLLPGYRYGTAWKVPRALEREKEAGGQATTAGTPIHGAAVLRSQHAWWGESQGGGNPSFALVFCASLFVFIRLARIVADP